MRRTLSPALVLVIALAGCARHPTARVTAPVDTGPVASSPTAAVSRLVWGWQHRDVTAATDMLTEDFQFVFSLADSAGNAFRLSGWGLAQERTCVQHLFVGGGGFPPASDIQLTTDRMQVEPDPRPGHQDRWHWTISTYVNLKVTVIGPDGTPSVTPVQGNSLFYLVRGDSALIPPELAARGVRPDSTRWWIDRWEDQTLGTSPGTSTEPTQNRTWGDVKALYLPSATVPTRPSRARG